MQGLVLLLIVGMTVWNGVTGYITLLRKPVRVWRFYVGPSSTLTVIWRTMGLHHLCWEGCILVARESGDSLADACICCKTPERKDGSPQKVEPGSKEGRGGNPKSLGCPYKLSHRKISVGGHHLGPGRPERGSCLLGECSDASYSWLLDKPSASQFR